MVQAPYPEEGWEPFSQDTPDAAEAWAAGRRAARHGFDLGCGQPGFSDGPQAKMLGLYLHDQDLRVEWERGWIYETYRMAQAREERDAQP